VRVGIVGLGNMGGPMAANLVAAGHDVVGFDAVGDRMRALEELGGRAATSPADAARDAEVVCIVVLDGDQVEAVSLGANGVLTGAGPGAVVAVHSTVHPDTVAGVADAAPDGVAVLDAPISGGVAGARAGSLAIMVGGDPTAIDRARPAFDAMGSLVLHLGPPGAGLAAKLARNLIGYVSLLGAQEGRRLARAAGVDSDLLMQILEHTGAVSPMMRDMLVVRGGDAIYSDNLGPLIDLAAKDLRVTLEFAANLGLDLPGTETALEHVADAIGPHDAPTPMSD
jgi:3-hydroxyisobutyrate dehydrogenase-like beta-hydroxyacid dehydrogenase